MTELELKYGCNPNQIPARIFAKEGALPVTVLNGRPGYINFMDALNAWQLVRELKSATGLCAAASFKHVSPAGAAVGLPLSDADRRAFFAPGDLSPLAAAYARARGADRVSSFGDWAALSDVCDVSTAEILKKEVSDGVIAPGYEPEALELLRAKRGGAYNIVQIDPAYSPASAERRDIFGVTFEQGRNEAAITGALLQNRPTANKNLSENAIRDLIIALITLKYTQSNSVCYAYDGQAVGIGAGQQSRIHCTRLAGDKADRWWLRRHPKALEHSFKGLGRPERDNAIDELLMGERLLSPAEKWAWLDQLNGVSLGSDAFFPFGDNIERAAQSGVKYIAQPGGSLRDGAVIAACDRLGMVMAFTGQRLFHH